MDELKCVIQLIGKLCYAGLYFKDVDDRMNCMPKIKWSKDYIR